MTGTTTQVHTLVETDPTTKIASGFTRIPAGTVVHVSRVRANGTCEIRLPGTLLSQQVRFSTIAPA